MSTMATRIRAGRGSCHEGDESNNLAKEKESCEHPERNNRTLLLSDNFPAVARRSPTLRKDMILSKHRNH